MVSLLKDLIYFKYFSSLDFETAYILSSGEVRSLQMLIFMFLSLRVRNGYSFLSINEIHPEFFFEGKEPELSFLLWKNFNFPTRRDILSCLRSCKVVSIDLNLKKPLIFFKNKLYFQKFWICENLIARKFLEISSIRINEKKLKGLLDFYFSKNSKWQKIAISTVMTNKLSIISGGPGTGKTFLVFFILIILIKMNIKKNLVIKLAAFTGKAAVRLIDSIYNQIKRFSLTSKEYKIFPKKVDTIHKLLGINKYFQKSFFNQENLLDLDVLIVDESSMIDLFTMFHLMNAIPKDARLIFIGDKDQLGAINYGSAFNDFCSFSKFKFSLKKVDQIFRITGYDLSYINKNKKENINRDKVCFLFDNYRFNSDSKIVSFLNAIKEEDISTIHHILDKNSKSIVFHNISESFFDYKKIIQDIANYYNGYFNLIKKKEYNYKKILNTFNSLRVLVPFKEGFYGSKELNNSFEDYLIRSKIIRFEKNYYNIHNRDYEGRPILVNENFGLIDIFNGDIGILLRDTDKFLKAFFFNYVNRKIRKVKIDCLSKLETSFFMTIHKAQGSEFECVILVLPPFFSSFFTKELIYTAITRTKKNLIIYANREIFIKSIKRKTENKINIFEQIINFNNHS